MEANWADGRGSDLGEMEGNWGRVERFICTNALGEEEEANGWAMAASTADDEFPSFPSTLTSKYNMMVKPQPRLVAFREHCLFPPNYM
jgi:hypothetical protein